ncbi:MAG: hypothetical protein GTO63_24910 [Anaerolineae bacterium]|nr:hypothetical protein [Anaerolineae bacterium]NIN97968.1 hypothetical protein [Anaerolineae bacterium]NIQ80931.1 hypothetical protein [Anaerolineae bacterium]
MVSVRILIALLVVASWYVAEDVPNSAGPYCGGPAPERWVAVDAALMHNGVVECGTRLLLYYPDAEPPVWDVVPVWDIGPLQSHGHYIEDYRGLPYMLDVEHRAWPVALDGLLSARVLIFAHYELPVWQEGVH